jgi:hypothetical protein
MVVRLSFDCNFIARWDESFADDLAVATGRVSSRVALLLRAAERHPDFFAQVCPLNIYFCFKIGGNLEGVPTD